MRLQYPPALGGGLGSGNQLQKGRNQGADEDEDALMDHEQF